MKSYLAVVALLVLVSCTLFVSADMASYKKRIAKKYFDGVKKANPNAVELKNGMIVEWIKKGDGETSPLEGTSCKMHYHGQLTNGEVFDSSMDRGQPIDFAPNQVISSWKLIMQYMRPGDLIRIHAPSELAYGERGSPPKIPGGATLVFKMQMLEVNGDGKPAAETGKAFADLTVDGVTIDDVKLSPDA